VGLLLRNIFLSFGNAGFNTGSSMTILIDNIYNFINPTTLRYLFLMMNMHRLLPLPILYHFIT